MQIITSLFPPQQEEAVAARPSPRTVVGKGPSWGRYFCGHEKSTPPESATVPTAEPPPLAPPGISHQQSRKICRRLPRHHGELSPPPPACPKQGTVPPLLRQTPGAGSRATVPAPRPPHPWGRGGGRTPSSSPGRERRSAGPRTLPACCATPRRLRPPANRRPSQPLRSPVTSPRARGSRGEQTKPTGGNGERGEGKG